MTAFIPTFDQSRTYFESRLGVALPARNKVQTRCKFHDDRTPSLSIDLAKGAWFCHTCVIGGGLIDFERRLTDLPDPECWDEINSTIGRPVREGPPLGGRTIVETYSYRDAAGKVVFDVVRHEPKSFRQRRPDGQGGYLWNMDGVVRIPFNLPDLITANIALIAEGERDALSLRTAAVGLPDNGGNLHYAATCNVGGAGKWLEEYSPYFAGKKVFVFQDNDEAGRRHAHQVCGSVYDHAYAVSLVDLPGLPEKGDVSDYLAAHSPSELFELMKSALQWHPSTKIPDMAASSEDKKPPGGFKLFHIGELLSRPEMPPDYLVDGLLVRGTVSCVVAKPKVGKSTFARGLALAVARGLPFLGRNTRQGKCIYLALEERQEEIVADFRAMGADFDDPIEVHADPAPASAIRSLEALVRKQRPELVVIDPLFRLANIRDEKAYAEVYTALGPLIDIARETGTHILLTHHAGKALKVDPIDSPLGSTAIGGAAATTIVLNRRESYRTIQTVTRIGPTLPETILSFDAKTRLLSVGETRAESHRHEVEEDIVEYLQTGEEKVESEILDHVEGANAVKRKALRALTERGALDRSGAGRKGDPYKYSYACTDSMVRTSVQESEKEPISP